MSCFIVAKALPLTLHYLCQALRKVQKNCQTLSVNSNPLDLFVESLLLDMFSLGIPLLRGGVKVLIFHKVSFEKHSSAQSIFKWFEFIEGLPLLLNNSTIIQQCWYQMGENIRYVVFAHHHRLTSDFRTGLTIFSCSCYNVNRNCKLFKSLKAVLLVEDFTG